uniref:Uncharacterized protein n=1 Tax=Ditylenchus dipsaci TaxID=166011 RepID=A0A915CZJ5_9BILA
MELQGERIIMIATKTPMKYQATRKVNGGSRFHGFRKKLYKKSSDLLIMEGVCFGSDLNNGSDKFSYREPQCEDRIQMRTPIVLNPRFAKRKKTHATLTLWICQRMMSCEHDHDSCSTQSGDGDNRDRYSRCDCCYCTYLSGDTPSQKQWDADRGHSLSSDVRDRVSEAETKVEIKNDVVEESQEGSSKARKLEEKKRAEEEDCAKRKALEEEKAKKRLNWRPKTLKRFKKRSQVQKATEAEATGRGRNEESCGRKKKHEEERQRKLADERQRQEAIKKEKAEKEARLQDEKRKRLEEQRQAKNVAQAKLGQSKDIITETQRNSFRANSLHQETHAETPPRFCSFFVYDASSSYFLSHGAESSGQSLPHLAVPGMEGSEDMQYLRQHASLIAATAAANGTPLPPLSSLSVEQQQQYFAWIKRCR